MLRNEQVTEFYALIQEGKQAELEKLPDLTLLVTTTTDPKNGGNALHVVLAQFRDLESKLMNALKKEDAETYNPVRLPLVRLFISKFSDKKAAVNAKDNDGTTPIMWVRELELAQLLLKHEANPHVRDRRGKSAVYYATTFAPTLVACLSAVSQTEYRIASPVLVDAAENLLSQNPDRNLGKSAEQHRAFFTLLELKETNVNAVKEVTGQTALHVAAKRDCLDAIDKLLTLKANANLPDKQGKTPLMFCQSKEAVARLVEFGAQSKVVDHEGRTALHHAAATQVFHVSGLPEVLGRVSALITAGCPIDKKDKAGKKAEELATSPESPEVRKYIQANQPNTDLRTALSCLSMFSESVQDLIGDYAITTTEVVLPAAALPWVKKASGS